MSVTKGGTAVWAAAALVINAFIWGVSWWPFRALQGYGLHPLWSTALMYLMVFALLLILKFKSGRGVLANPGLWLLGLASGLTNVGFNWAVTVGDVVRVVLLFYLMPAWSVLIAWLMLGEKPTFASLLRLTMAMAGVLIVLKTPASPWPIPQDGADWLALMGGLTFAITNALLRKFKHAPSDACMLAMFGGGALMATLAALIGMSQQIVPGIALQAAGLKSGAEWRVASDDPTYQAWVRNVMADQTLFRVAEPATTRPDGWPPTRYEAKALRAGRQPLYWTFRRRG